MKTVKQPNSRRNLDAAIRRLAENDIIANRLRLTMANVIVGQVLPGGVVKGGSALKLRYGNAVHPRPRYGQERGLRSILD